MGYTMKTRKQLRAARLGAGLTQAEVASAIGLSRPLVSLVEIGLRGLSPDRSERISAAIEKLAAARQAADAIMSDAIRAARHSAY